MMRTADEIKAILKDNEFCSRVGVEFVSADAEGGACSVLLEHRHVNGYGNAMGGVIFTLADFAFGIAACGHYDGIVTLSSSMNFVAPAKPGMRLTATSKMRSSGFHVCVVDVDVRDDTGTLIATSQFTGYGRKSD